MIVDSTGHLGTVVSSARFKDAIKPMDKASEAILALQPVTFRYKHELDPDGIPQFGLVAEQVEKVNPDLVARDEKRQALHRALRSGERDVAQRVSQGASQGGGTRSNRRGATERLRITDCGTHRSPQSTGGANPEGERPA